MKLAYMLATDEVGPHQVTALRGPPEAACAAIRAAGFAGVELLIRDAAAIDQGAVERAVRRAGLVVPAICTGEVFGEDGLSFADPDPGIREAARARMTSAMALGARFGAPVNVGRLRGRYHPGTPRAQTLGWIAEALETCCAAHPDVRVVIEPVNRQFTDCLCTTAQTMEFLRGLGIPTVGIMIDNVHVEVEGEDMAAALALADPVLWHLHISDSARLPLGAGSYDLRATLDLYERCRPGGWVTVETFQTPDDDTALGQSAAFLEGAGRP